MLRRFEIYAVDPNAPEAAKEAMNAGIRDCGKYIPELLHSAIGHAESGQQNSCGKASASMDAEVPDRRTARQRMQTDAEIFHTIGVRFEQSQTAFVETLKHCGVCWLILFSRIVRSGSLSRTGRPFADASG